ncbi:hypothetical protein FB451DRAFT_1184076 [Mycena latifolia]|nr:hypothetical protein FB451DRAFT_1184076 [Mycena latifolia]
MSPTTSTTTTPSTASRRFSWNGSPVDLAAVFTNNIQSASQRRRSSLPASATHHRSSPCPRRSALKPSSESPSEDSSRASSPTLSSTIEIAVNMNIGPAAEILSQPKGMLHRLRRMNVLARSPPPPCTRLRIQQHARARVFHIELPPAEWDELSLTPESDMVEILPTPERKPLVEEVCIVEEACEQLAWCDFM